MNRRLLFSACVALFLLSACKTTDSSLDDADNDLAIEERLISRHIEASGGSALAELQSLKWEGTAFVPAAGWSLPLTVFQMRPGMGRSEVKIEEMGGLEIIQAYDGETAWTINPMVTRRPQKLDGLEARPAISLGDVGGTLANAERLGKTVEYVAEEEVRGEPAHHLRVTSQDGSVVHVWLAADTHLVIKSQARGINPMQGGEVEVETFMSDYREVEGVQIPYEMETLMGGEMAQRITVESVEMNPELDAEMFRFPGETQ